MAKKTTNAEFSSIIAEINKKQEKKDMLAIKARKALTLSKTAIYSVHRNDMKKAKNLIAQAKLILKNIAKSKEAEEISFYNAAVQEFIEAITFYTFISKSSLLAKKEISKYLSIKVKTEDYILALSDLTGELGRKAVLLAIEKNLGKIIEIKSLVDEIYGLFLQLNLKNGEIRKKSDAIKWNLKKIEEIIYDLKKS